MSRARSYEPERVQLPDGNEAWITPALAVKGWEAWYSEATSDSADAIDPNPPLPAEAMFAMLASGVTAWSLTDDESGQRAPINLETVSRLTWDMGKPLADWCNDLIGEAVREQFEATSRALEGGS